MSVGGSTDVLKRPADTDNFGEVLMNGSSPRTVVDSSVWRILSMACVDVDTTCLASCLVIRPVVDTAVSMLAVVSSAATLMLWSRRLEWVEMRYMRLVRLARMSLAYLTLSPLNSPVTAVLDLTAEAVCWTSYSSLSGSPLRVANRAVRICLRFATGVGSEVAWRRLSRVATICEWRRAARLSPSWT
ncbi:hypothetical protein NP493_490g00005 [Ridgeia piscesae]|uniref:Uncharacterized protein n=1 Tax=Ridgeia piscesae TaxID=27915 RepID=A0AAD9KYY0_RIDPI|nr:hypothetical protein NP493_490g00005 [Ridgeia piscesae]